MLRWALLLLSVLTLCLSTTFAQSRDEAKFNQKQAKVMHGFAQDAFKAGFPKVAKRIWLELLSEYDPDHEAARDALGYERVGDSWSKRSGFSYPKDDNPDPKKAASLSKEWSRTAAKLALEHKKLAREYDKAGRADLARKHFEKVLHFTPEDEEAQAALHHKAVAGLTGTDLEQTLYDRSKKIEKIVAEEARQDYPVERLPDSDKNGFLEKAQVPYISVQSEHFTVRGDYEEELLMEAARYGERAVRVMQVAVEGYPGFNLDPKTWIREWAFFQDADTYAQVLNANVDIVGEDRLQYLVEQTRGTNLVTRGAALELSAPNNEQGVFDGAVRNVAQTMSAFRSAGLREGIGHTIVGMVFNNNRAFIVDREKQLRTTTGEEDLDKYSPNMDTWKDLALESAWKLTEGVSAAQLPLIDAAKFTDEARIKSWSFCDYVMRRDPSLLLDLDRLSDQGHQIEVEKKFTSEHDGLSVAQLEKEWKDFWTEASPVLKAIRNNTEPLSAVSKDVKKWLKAFNDARKARNSTEVTWSADYSGRCREHAEYLLLHEEQRGPAAEQNEEIDLEGGSHLGDMFAEMALVDTGASGKPKKVFERWLDHPGYRDALLNYRLRTIGLYVQDGVLVMDAIRGLGRPPEGKGGLEMFPDNTAGAVPTSVKVADLGPELAALLEREGHGGLEVVGYPISLHQFGNGGLVGNRDSYKCIVKVGDKPIEGILHMADGGTNRHTSAPGMIVFYPLEPLRKGMDIEVTWIWETDKGITRKSNEFKT